MEVAEVAGERAVVWCSGERLSQPIWGQVRRLTQALMPNTEGGVLSVHVEGLVGAEDAPRDGHQRVHQADRQAPHVDAGPGWAVAPPQQLWGGIRQGARPRGVAGTGLAHIDGAGAAVSVEHYVLGFNVAVRPTGCVHDAELICELPQAAAHH